jgi:hypothetical protein
VLAQDLRRKGAIKYRRGKIFILDRSTLEACACECHKKIENIHKEMLSPNNDRNSDRLGADEGSFKSGRILFRR